MDMRQAAAIPSSAPSWLRRVLAVAQLGRIFADTGTDDGSGPGAKQAALVVRDVASGTKTIVSLPGGDGPVSSRANPLPPGRAEPDLSAARLDETRTRRESRVRVRPVPHVARQVSNADGSRLLLLFAGTLNPPAFFLSSSRILGGEMPRILVAMSIGMMNGRLATREPVARAPRTFASTEFRSGFSDRSCRRTPRSRPGCG